MSPPVSDGPDGRIPVTVITGCLGSGKTTLLNHWVKQPELADCAVLINEFGAIGLDHHLVQKLETPTLVLDSGCLCCSLQGSLVEALRDLFLQALRRQIKPFRRLLIETTGLADPSPVIFSLRHDPFIAQRYRFDGTLTVVDAVHIRQQLARLPEAGKQVAMADRLAISKADLIAPAALAAVQRQLGELNPGAPQQPMAHGALSPALLEQMGPFGSGHPPRQSRVLRWLRGAPARPGLSPAAPGSPAPHAGIHALCLRLPRPLPRARLFAALHALQERHGDNLLRVKGLLQVQEQATPLVVHCVHGQIYPITSLPEWPEGIRESRLVFIVRDIPEAHIRALLAAHLETDESGCR